MKGSKSGAFLLISLYSLAKCLFIYSLFQSTEYLQQISHHHLSAYLASLSNDSATSSTAVLNSDSSSPSSSSSSSSTSLSSSSSSSSRLSLSGYTFFALFGSSLILMTLQKGWSYLFSFSGHVQASFIQAKGKKSTQLTKFNVNGLLLMCYYLFTTVGLKLAGPIRTFLILEFLESFLTLLPSLLCGIHTTMSTSLIATHLTASSSSLSAKQTGRKRGIFLISLALLLLFLSQTGSLHGMTHTAAATDATTLPTSTSGSEGDSDSESAETLSVKASPSAHTVTFKFSETVGGTFLLILAAIIGIMSRNYEKKHGKEFGGRKRFHALSMAVATLFMLPLFLLSTLIHPSESTTVSDLNSTTAASALGAESSASASAMTTHAPSLFMTLLSVIFFQIILQFYIDVLPSKYSSTFSSFASSSATAAGASSPLGLSGTSHAALTHHQVTEPFSMIHRVHFITSFLFALYLDYTWFTSKLIQHYHVNTAAVAASPAAVSTETDEEGAASVTGAAAATSTTTKTSSFLFLQYSHLFSWAICLAACLIFLGNYMIQKSKMKQLTSSSSSSSLPLYEHGSSTGVGVSSSASSGGHGLTGFSIRELRMMLKHFLTDPTSRRIFSFLCINFLFMFVELIYGFYSNSLGLISDAGHMLFDSTALGIGLYASYVSKITANNLYTFGYDRYEVISGFVNGIFLLFIGYFIFVESVERLFQPPEIQSESLVVVSVLGLCVNMVGLFFFHDFSHGHSHGGSGGGCGGHGGHGHSHGSAPSSSSSADEEHGHSHGAGSSCGGGDHGHSHSHGGSSKVEEHHETHANHNVWAIYLHILADALGSVGVIISSLLVQYKGWTWADAVCSIVISVLIVGSVIPLVQNTLEVLLQRTPRYKEKILSQTLYELSCMNGVLSYREPHFWNFSDSIIVGSICVQVREDMDTQNLLLTINSLFKKSALGIKHMCVQIEKEAFLQSLDLEVRSRPLLTAGQM